MKYFALIALFIVIVIGSKSVLAEDELSYGTMMHGGLERSFYYLIPEGKPTTNMPLLLSLHGGGKKDGDDYAARTGYVKLAQKEGFVVVFPNGMDSQWNDGRGMTFRGIEDNTHIDDAGYLAAVMDYFTQKYGLDKGRIYLEGSSNGGMMTYRTLCEYSGKIAAAAAVISSMPENIYSGCKPNSPVSVLSMNAIDDPWVPFDGGDVEVGLFRKKKSGVIISTYKNMGFWAAHNGCDQMPEVRFLPDSVDDGTTIVRKIYGDCANDTNVELYEVHGGGHSRPGMYGFVPERLLGKKSEEINSGAVIWDFLKVHAKR